MQLFLCYCHVGEREDEGFRVVMRLPPGFGICFVKAMNLLWK